MNLTQLTERYFSHGTLGYKILSTYYSRYRDLFEKTVHPEFTDFLNQVLLNVTTINFSKEINNIEAYIIGTIKMQCRVQLDRAIKMKNTAAERIYSGEENENPIVFSIAGNENPAEQLDFQEMFVQLNLFKLQLKKTEVDILNSLIDEKQRKEIAEELNLNLNTLDTQIRRLRLKIADHFQKLGYSSDIIDKFGKE